MLFRGNDARDEERREFLRLVLDALDFEADHRQAIDNGAERSRRFEMLVEPAEGEFHGWCSSDHGRISFMAAAPRTTP